MSNTRAPGQKLISVPMNDKFIQQIDAALHKVGYSDRSSFIRDAIVEKLHAGGISIPLELSLAPSRTGKGGRPPVPVVRQSSLSEVKPSAETRTTTAMLAAKRQKTAKPPRGKTKFRIPGGSESNGPAHFGRNFSAT